MTSTSELVPDARGNLVVFFLLPRPRARAVEPTRRKVSRRNRAVSLARTFWWQAPLACEFGWSPQGPGGPTPPAFRRRVAAMSARIERSRLQS